MRIVDCGLTRLRWDFLRLAARYDRRWAVASPRVVAGPPWRRQTGQGGDQRRRPPYNAWALSALLVACAPAPPARPIKGQMRRPIAAALWRPRVLENKETMNDAPTGQGLSKEGMCAERLSRNTVASATPRFELMSLDDVSRMEQSIPNWHDGPPKNPSVFPKICRQSTRINARSGCEMVVEMDVHPGIA
jgi:hypothetical protein